MAASQTEVADPYAGRLPIASSGTGLNVAAYSWSSRAFLLPGSPEQHSSDEVSGYSGPANGMQAMDGLAGFPRPRKELSCRGVRCTACWQLRLLQSLN